MLYEEDLRAAFLFMKSVMLEILGQYTRGLSVNNLYWYV